MKAPERKPIRDAVREAAIFKNRAWVAFMAVCLTFCVLSGRYIYLQVFSHKEFTTRAENNRVKYRALAPNRGLILDRNGVILADNRPAYRLEVIPEQVEDLEATLTDLAAMMDISEAEIARFTKLRRARRSFQSVPLKLRLNEKQVALFAVDRHLFPGVDIVPYQTRVYPLADNFAHVLGYVGQLDANDLNAVDSGRYAATSHIGKIGLEQSYESQLHGEVGREKVETNVKGRVLRSLDKSPPTPGNNLYLTIDAQLQDFAVQALGDFTGAIVAIEPGSGEVLAMVSQPGYDPNEFVAGLSVNDYQALVQSPQRPLFNRALRGGYEPGSTIKPYMALAGLESGTIELDTVMVSRGYFQLPGQPRRYRDWKPGGHGEVDVIAAIEQSVNTYFYDMASRLGIDAIHDYVSQFGFGRPTGIDLYGEASGVLPSRRWKREQLNEPWYPGETVIAGIGQGFNVTTPMQLAHAAAVLAARGTSAQPHLVRHVGSTPPDLSDLASDNRSVTRVLHTREDHMEAVIDGMIAVVHGKRGSARAIIADDPPFVMAGKSGTAQVLSLIHI